MEGLLFVQNAGLAPERGIQYHPGREADGILRACRFTQTALHAIPLDESEFRPLTTRLQR